MVVLNRPEEHHHQLGKLKKRRGQTWETKEKSPGKMNLPGIFESTIKWRWMLCLSRTKPSKYLPLLNTLISFHPIPTFNNTQWHILWPGFPFTSKSPVMIWGLVANPLNRISWGWDPSLIIELLTFVELEGFLDIIKIVAGCTRYWRMNQYFYNLKKSTKFYIVLEMRWG